MKYHKTQFSIAASRTITLLAITGTDTIDTRSLAGKIAIFTGGSRGIGKAIAIELVKQGVTGITITYSSNVTSANDTVAELKALGAQALAIKASSTIDNASADDIIQQTLRAFSSETIDILINNAAHMGFVPLGIVTPKEFYDFYNVNLLAPYLLTQAILPVIAKGGSIIDISSTTARTVSGQDPVLGGGSALYSSSKAALEHLTRELASKYCLEKRITMNVVAPGGTETEALKLVGEETRRAIAQVATAEKRLGTVEEVADVVGFLCGGGGARWINGDTIQVSGGSAMF